MSTTEGVLQAEIRLAIGREQRLRLWRNNRGIAWLPTGKGKIVHQGRSVLITEARPVEYGLTQGASDLIGLLQVTITPDMVGTTLAAFCAAEVKPIGVTVPEHQERFIDFVSRFGGIAGVVRSPEDARRLFNL